MKFYFSSMKTTVSEKGQITIPKSLRDRLGIRPGQVLEVREEQGRLVMFKRMPSDALDDLYGSLDLGCSTDEFIGELRGIADAVDPE